MTAMADTNVRETIIMVRWVLITACGYLILFSDHAPLNPVAGPIVVAAFLASNLLLGRLPREQFGTRGFKIAIGAVDTVLIAISLYLGDQFSVEMLMLFLAVVVLAAAGLEIGVIARITLALSVADVALVWLTGNELAWRSSMLLRVPFLLSAGLVYGALVEAGFAPGGNMHRIPLVAIDALTAGLLSQRDAILRCQSAMADGGSAAARVALQEIATQNEEMQAKIGRL